MNIPWVLIAIFVALSFFYYVQQKTKLRREQRRERLKEKRQDYLDQLVHNLSHRDEPNSGEPQIPPTGNDKKENT